MQAEAERGLVEFGYFVPVEIHDFPEVCGLDVVVDLGQVEADVLANGLELVLQAAEEGQFLLQFCRDPPAGLFLLSELPVVLFVDLADHFLPLILEFLLGLGGLGIHSAFLNI